MAHDRVNVRTGVGACKNQANFTDIAVNNIPTLLLKLIGINGQLIHIAITNQFLAHVARFAIVELTIGIHAFVHVLQQSMPKNIVRVIMLMVPHERDLCSIIVNEGVFHDGTTIGAPHVGSSSPTTEVIISGIHIHFDSFLLTYIFELFLISSLTGIFAKSTGEASVLDPSTCSLVTSSVASAGSSSSYPRFALGCEILLLTS